MDRFSQLLNCGYDETGTISIPFFISFFLLLVFVTLTSLNQLFLWSFNSSSTRKDKIERTRPRISNMNCAATWYISKGVSSCINCGIQNEFAINLLRTSCSIFCHIPVAIHHEIAILKSLWCIDKMDRLKFTIQYHIFILLTYRGLPFGTENCCISQNTFSLLAWHFPNVSPMQYFTDFGVLGPLVITTCLFLTTLKQTFSYM